MAKRKPLDLKREIGAIVHSEERVFEHDRSKSAGASEIFRCHRRVFMKKRTPELADEAEDHDDIEWGMTERGNVIENAFAAPKIKAIVGEGALYMGDEQRTLMDDKAPLSCTPDGLIVAEGRDFLANYNIPDLGEEENDIAVEIKTFDPRSGDLTTSPRTPHMGQNIVQQGMFQRVTNYKPKWGIVIYFNPANLKDIRPFPVKYDNSVYEQAQLRALKVFDLTMQAKDFRPEGKRSGECQYCEFFTACMKVEKDSMPTGIVKTAEIDEKTLTDLGDLTRTVASQRAQLRALEKTVKENIENLRFMMIDLGTTRAGDTKKLGWLCSLRMQSGRKSFNKEAAKADGVDIDKYMIQGPDFFVINAKSKDVVEEKDE